ncbi:MAG: undecaprenyl-diphosphate phosphatase [Blastochloris sp.]|nr:undecaprenyl-diphosphate phosphatase [Blastochloris sp.]
MPEWLQTIILGIIEGITEFLPISSTGHLIIAQHFFGEVRSEFFNIGIQSGAVLAVVLIYWRKILTLIVEWKQPANFSYLLKGAAAFAITVVLALVCKKLGFQLPDDPEPIAWAVLIGAFLIFAAEYHLKSRKPIEHITWIIAISIGLAQVVAAIFPGSSRSGCTIMLAMLLGTSRVAATEFSFLLGIPTLLAASGYSFISELKEKGSLPAQEYQQFALGFVVSTIVAFLAVRWLLNYIRTKDFIPFAWYRLALGTGLLAWLWIRT